MNQSSDKEVTIRGLISGIAEYINENMLYSVPGFQAMGLGLATKFRIIFWNSAEQEFRRKNGETILRMIGPISERF